MPATTALNLVSLPDIHHHFNPKHNTNLKQRREGIKCCNSRRGKQAEPVNYYELLGVSVHSSPREIKQAYRRLQKKHHPDVAGQKGHEYTLMLNEAYQVLMGGGLQRNGTASGRKGHGSESNFSGLGFSSWNGPLQPQALFVDENKCIGCRECVYHASQTFMMDESLGCARVKVQSGDDEKKIEVHEYTLMLNEAYQALMRGGLQRNGTASGRKGHGTESNFSGLGFSSWNGPLQPRALFVDENKCIGCRECVYHASQTFMMDESLGCARVKVQSGDNEKKIEVSVDSCPVNCIHWVDREELPVLEFLIRPQPKEANGVFGGGWERPANVFAAAKYFIKQSKQQESEAHHSYSGKAEVEDETPAQAKARYDASLELQMEKIWGSWSYFREQFLGQK